MTYSVFAVVEVSNRIQHFFLSMVTVG